MSLELFNKTNRTKELPKYNYAGKFRLAPGATYPIQDYMVSFYRPWNKVGVIVRNSAIISDTIEPEVKKVIEESKEDKVVEAAIVENVAETKVEEKPTETVVEEVKEEIIEETPAVEQVEFVEPELVEIDKPEEVVETETKEETKVYTKEELENLTVSGVREIVEKLGLEVTEGDLRKKTPYIDAILNYQSN